ncbi:MazG-like family protein [Cryptosporangium aurantiacum]|uniref:MazG nucleotide pyrophosphohydrolase domain-containing protein n=1 Tax=Cryptosporangium aurantiacum TaxID=134849 RepID=A0A1M7RJC5_9ACTN|nr:MazG-like family protein [Cryptosporangium aurantiacum]SHN46445.1 hypothetical protein SAMN05443668_115134 [Cryptosporangium aurantiacum]
MTEHITTPTTPPEWMWGSRALAPTAELFAVATAVIDVAAWLDRHDTRPPIERKTLRVLKVAEETGEAVAAWIGVTGQNPRKGVTATRRDVARELSDVAFSALTALHSLDEDLRGPERCACDPVDALAEAYQAWRWINGHTETATPLPDPDVTDWLLDTVATAGHAAAALLYPEPDRLIDAAGYLAGVVTCACLGIAALGIDPNTQLAETARAVAARIDAPGA